MKKSFNLLVISSFVLIGALASAQSAPKTQTRVIRKGVLHLPVDLNTSTVKCSAKGYGMPELKVLVPALAKVTVLNHRNDGEGAPCITAGECTNDLNPEKILSGGSGQQTIPVGIRVIQELTTDQETQTCHVTLKEEILSEINGVTFKHLRTQDLGNRDIADCF